MDDSYELGDEPTPPPPPKRPPAVLPRYKSEASANPEPERNDVPKAKPSKSSKPKDSDSENKGEKKTVLIEETPEFDAVETRQKLRFVIGAVSLAVVGFVIWSLVGMLGGGPAAEDGAAEEVMAEGDGPPLVPPPPSRNENEARVALSDARNFAKRGDLENTIKRLRVVIENYPKTPAAKEAGDAMQRGAQGKPIFLDLPLLAAANTPKAEVPKPEVAPPPIEPTDLAKTEDTKPFALLPPPATPPELYHPTNLQFASANVPARPLPVGFRAREEAGIHPVGWPWEITCDADGSAMRFVPADTFLMGSNDGPGEERPMHKVALGGFYIDQHEVTVRQFALFRAKNPSGLKPTANDPGSSSNSEESPAVQVTYRDAQAYAEWAGKKVPTEAQWEMAARGAESRRFPWGNTEPKWDRPRKPGQIDPVMSFPSDLSPFGVYDMAGNASEWVADLFDPGYYAQFRSVAAVDPQGPTRVRSRIPNYVVKGGSKTWETSWRNGLKAETRSPQVGFRCALPVEVALPATPPPGSIPGAPGAAPPGAPPAVRKNAGGLAPF